MPRIPHSIILRAHNKSSLLPLVLRGSRDLQSSINELRWLVEHVQGSSVPPENPIRQRGKLLQLCLRRSRGEPLQYLLGSQPFGELDIKCRPGVLIPRPETEAYASYLARLLTTQSLENVCREKFGTADGFLVVLKSFTPDLNILDLCTGSGCISLLLNSIITKNRRNVQIYGWDISQDAISLAKENLKRNIATGHVRVSTKSPVRFDVVDIFDDGHKLQGRLMKQAGMRKTAPAIDVIISNPPYISQNSFKKETSRSVRNWEPKLALVPQKLPEADIPDNVITADIFYQRLLLLHTDFFKSRILLMEIGDEAQALRVVRMAIDHCWASNAIEIWRDWPEQNLGIEVPQEVEVNGFKVHVRGSGNFRAVALFAFGRTS